MIVKVSLSFSTPDSALVDTLEAAGVKHKIDELPEDFGFCVTIELQTIRGRNRGLYLDNEFQLAIMNRILKLKSLIPDMPRYAPTIDLWIRNAEHYSSLHLHRDLVRMITDLDANFGLIIDNFPDDIERIN